MLHGLGLQQLPQAVPQQPLHSGAAQDRLAVHGRNAVVPVDHEFVVAVAQDCLVVVPPTPTPIPEAGVFRNLSASRE